MGDILKFPTIKKRKVEDSEKQEGEIQDESQVLEFKNKPKKKEEGTVAKACLFEGAPSVVIGGEIVVEIYGRKYRGIVLNKFTKGGNITQVSYDIPFLNGDDPLKFGVADFTYDIEQYD